MKTYRLRLLITVLYISMSGTGYAQSKLPPCQGSYSPTWTNCIANITFSNGTKYVGGTIDGKMNGYGTIIHGDGPYKGEKYVGEFKDDQRSGWGTWTGGANMPGYKYVGDFKNDLKDGEGTLFYPDGKIWLEGLFSKGEFIESRKVQPRSVKIEQAGDPLILIKARCKDLGFKPSSEEFKKCVLQLSK